MLVILTGVIGGTLTHGLVGLFLGPVVLSVFYELVVAWTRLGSRSSDPDAPSAIGARLMDHPAMNPAAPHHLPSFITGPGQSDWLMTVMAVFLLVAIVSVGLLYLKLHALPEHMAHRTNKVQLQFVAVLACSRSSPTTTSSGSPACCSPSSSSRTSPPR